MSHRGFVGIGSYTQRAAPIAIGSYEQYLAPHLQVPTVVPPQPPALEAVPTSTPAWIEPVMAFGAGALAAAGFLGLGLAVRDAWIWSTSTVEQRGIRKWAEKHEAAGHEVAADHIGWRSRPTLVKHGALRRRPDITLKLRGGGCVYEEHETSKSVGRKHSREQDRDLRKIAAAHGCRYVLRVHPV